MRRSEPMCMTLFNKCNNTLAQLNRMRLAHNLSPLSILKENHKSNDLGIMNHIKRNTL